MKDMCIELKTNFLANFIKLTLALMIILLAAKAYHHIDFYGLNEIWFIPLMLLIGWMYRITFFEKIRDGADEIDIRVSKNIFGFFYITLVDSNSQVIFFDRVNKVKFSCKLSNRKLKLDFELAPRFKPLCKITSIDEP